MNASIPPSAKPSSRNPRRKPDSDRPTAPPVSIAPPPPEPSRAGRIARAALGFALVVGIGGTVAYGARRYVKTSPRFAVNEIVTIGGKHRTAEELATIAGVAKGQNIFTTDLDKAKQRLVADPWISDATLSRQLPGTVFVQVTEREPAGIVAMATGETYLVTREGTIIKRVEPSDPTDLPIVTGVKLEQLVDDRDGAARTIRRALDLAFDYDHAPLSGRAALQEIHVEANGEMNLVVGKNGIALHMGAPPYRRKLEQAVRVVAELDRRGAKADAIMLDNEARPDRVVVRMR